MTTTAYFLSSVNGNDNNDGLSWATALATLNGVNNLNLVADIVVYVDSNHVDNFPVQSPFQLGLYGYIAACVSVDRSQWPTVVEKAGAQVNYYSASQLLVGGFIMRGFTFNLSTASAAGQGNGFGSTTKAQAQIEAVQFLNGQLQIGSISTTNGYGYVSVSDSFHKPSIAAGYINLGNGILRWYGGGFSPGSYALNQIFANPLTAFVDFVMDGADLSALPAGVAITSTGSAGKIVLKNCKLPSGWTGTLFLAAPTHYQTVEMYNCDSGATNYRIYIGQYAGTLRESTAVVKTGGATDGTTALSWAVTTNANARSAINGGTAYSMGTPEIAYWNEAVGAPITLGVDVLADTTPLTSSEAWLEVSYLGDSASPKSSPAVTRTKLSASPTTHPSSAAAWSGGPASPQVQKLQFTFTPRAKGLVMVRVRIARASATVYVDPTVMVA